MAFTQQGFDGSTSIAFGALLRDLGGSLGNHATYWQSSVHDLDDFVMPQRADQPNDAN